MRVTSVELHPDGSTEVCELSFRDPRGLNPYNVKEMSGLDASDGIAPKFYGVSANSVAKFFNLSLIKREPVLRISLNPRPGEGAWGSYSDLRDNLYRMIASSRTGLVQIQFKNERGVVAAISGFLTKFETPHFDKTPEVQLTFEAVDPWLKAIDPVSVSVASLDAADTLIHDGLSTAPHGFSFTLTALGAFPSLVISDPNTDTWSFGIAPAGGFLNLDTLHFSSDPNDMQLFIVRGASTIYLADVITPGSIWPIIFPRDNHFALSNPTLVAWADISYYPTYWGV